MDVTKGSAEMAGEATGAAPAAGDPPAGTDPKATGAPPATPPATGTEGEEGAGSHRKVLAELADERKARQKLEADLASMKEKHQTEAEKAIEAAKRSGRDEALAEVNGRVVRSEVRAAAAGKVSDPEDAVTLLGDLDRFVVKGEVDTKAITSAIDELVKAKPYLAPANGAGTRPKPLPGGGATSSSGTSINDVIRQKAGRG